MTKDPIVLEDNTFLNVCTPNNWDVKTLETEIDRSAWRNSWRLLQLRTPTPYYQ